MEPRLERIERILADGTTVAPGPERLPLDLAAEAEVLKRAGDTAEAVGRVTAAADWFRAHPARGGAGGEAALEGAAVLILAGFRARGLDLLRIALKEDRLPPDGTGALLSAYAEIEDGDPAAAAAALESLYPAFAGHPEIDLVLALLALARGANASALDFAGRVGLSGRFPRESALLEALAHVLAGDPAAALPRAESANAAAPSRDGIRLEAWILHALGRRDEARARLAAFPDRDAGLEGLLGFFDFFAGDHIAARARLETAGVGPKALHLRILGDIAASAGDRPRAILLYDERLAADPADRTTRINLAHVRLLEGDLEGADAALAPLFAVGEPPGDDRARALREKIDAHRRLHAGET